ncbi:MAG TPA: DUF3108 domain-containing protein [Kofleriaceae bacterium]
MVRSWLVLVLFAACGSSHLDVAKPTAPAVNKLPDGPPLVTPGEHMQYKLSLRGVELAVYDLAIGDITDFNGKRAIVVQSHAKTVGLGALIKVDDYFSSWVDVATGRPLHWKCDEYASNGKDKEKTDADLAGRQGDSIPIAFHLNDDPPKTEPQHVSLPEVWDYNSFLIALRGWEGAPGSTVTAEVFRSRFLWHVEMKIHGREQLHTQLGELPALRLDGHTYKLDKDGSRDPGSDERNFSVWISDDDGRVPLEVKARTDYGDIEMVIVDYQPGTGQRLR